MKRFIIFLGILGGAVILLLTPMSPLWAQVMKYGYVTNHNDGTVSVINLFSQHVLDTPIYVGGSPHNVVISPDGRWVYVTNLDGYISVIDATTNAVVSTISSLYEPGGLYFSPDGTRAFVAYGTYPIRVRVFETNYHSDILDFQISNSEVNSDILLSPDGETLYVLDSSKNKLYRLEAATGDLLAQINVGFTPSALVASPDGEKLYVANSGSNTVIVVSTIIDAATDTLYTDSSPNTLALCSDGKTLCVGHQNSNCIRIFDLEKGSYSDMYVGGGVSDITLYRDKFLYVVSQYDYSPISVYNITNGLLATNLTVGTDPQKIDILNLSYQEGTSPLPGVTDLLVANALSDQVNLVWTAVGNDTVTSLFYDVRYHTVPITNENWRDAVEIPNALIPSPQGQKDSIVVQRLNASTDYYFALRVIDNQLNTTILSNMVTATTLSPPKIDVSPDSFTISLTEEDSLTSSLRIGNAEGGAPLEFRIEGAVTPDCQGFSYAYVSNSNEGTVSVIDLKKQGVVANVFVGGNPTQVTLSPNGKYVYVGVTSGVAIIDTKTNKVVGTISTQGYSPTGIVFSPNSRKAYIAYGRLPFRIKVFDAVTNNELATFYVTSSDQNSGISISPDGKTLYLLDNFQNQVLMVDASDGTVISSIPVNYDPRDIVISPDGDIAYVANYNSNTISVIQIDIRQTIQVFSTHAGPNSLVISADGKKLYVGHAYSNLIRIFDLETELYSDLEVQYNVADIALAAGGNYLYLVPTSDDSQVMIYNTESGYLVNSISVGQAPARIAILPTRPRGMIRIDTSEGWVPVQGTTEVGVVFNAVGIESGNYSEEIVLTTNDPETPMVKVPVSISVLEDTTPPLPVTDLTFTAGGYTYFTKSFDETKTEYYTLPAATSTHRFDLRNFQADIDSGKVTVAISGDFDNNNEYATVSIEGFTLGKVYGDYTGSGSKSWSLFGERIMAWANDGQIEIKVQNSSAVGVYIQGYDRHEVRLQIFSDDQDSTYRWDAVTLSWTATGDDLDQGQAFEYDLRYGYTPIDSSNWDRKIHVVGEPRPQIAGSEESMVIPNLIPYLTHYFALKVADEAGNWSTLSNVVSGVPDQGSPVLQMKFFQDPVLTQFLDIILLSSEPLDSLAMGVVQGDSIEPLAVMTLDSNNFVYKADYTLSHSDTITFWAEGHDLAQNSSSITRALNVGLISPAAGGLIASSNGRMSLKIEPESFSKEIFVTLTARESETPDNTSRALGPEYQLGPGSRTLQKPATLTFRYQPYNLRGADVRYVGIYRSSGDRNNWVLLNCQIDTVARIISTEISQLGKYRLLYDPDTNSDLIQIVPHTYTLFQNYPNPFNAQTVIRYTLPMSSEGQLAQRVRLCIYNLLGQEVITLVDGFQKPGIHTVLWQGENSFGDMVSSGVYFYELKAGDFHQVKKMVMIR